jgi:hypothetical protein
MSDLSKSTPHLPAPIATSETSTAKPANLGAIIGRIEQVIEEETAGIRRATSYDLKASNARKSRYLYELTRAMKGVDQAESFLEYKDSLLRLRQKLAKNEAAIKAHLNAVAEVANLLKSAIQRSEADGTYTAGEFGWAQS